MFTLLPCILSLWSPTVFYSEKGNFPSCSLGNLGLPSLGNGIEYESCIFSLYSFLSGDISVQPRRLHTEGLCLKHSSPISQSSMLRGRKVCAPWGQGRSRFCSYQKDQGVIILRICMNRQ